MTEENDFVISEDDDTTENVSVTEAKEIFDSVKLDVDDSVVAPVEEAPKKTGGRKKKDLPTPSELKQMSDKDVLDLDSKTKELYNEFSSFLDTNVKIKEDSGVKETIPSSIQILDAYMGGGFAVGTMSMITGTPGSGKSTLAIQAMAGAQQKYVGDVLVSYLDSEEATTSVRLANLGVRFPKIKPYTDITIEKVFKFLEGMCIFKEQKKIVNKPSVVIWDSIANTLSQKERETEDVNSVIGYKARALSLLLPKYVAKLALYNICLITVNQLRDLVQIGPYQQAKELKFMTQGKDIPGGNALKFNAFHLLEMKVKGTTTTEKHGFDGFVAEVNCVKNKLFTPNIKFQIVGNFVTGFSNYWTNYLFLVDNKRINTGAWNWLVSNPEKKFRTKDSINMYNNDPIFKAAFDEAVKECIETEIIKKYNPELE